MVLRNLVRDTSMDPIKAPVTNDVGHPYAVSLKKSHVMHQETKRAMREAGTDMCKVMEAVGLAHVAGFLLAGH